MHLWKQLPILLRETNFDKVTENTKSTKFRYDFNNRPRNRESPKGWRLVKYQGEMCRMSHEPKVTLHLLIYTKYNMDIMKKIDLHKYYNFMSE